MATNINLHGVTRIGISKAAHHANKEIKRSFWACSIVIACDDGTTQEIGLYSDSENALELADPEEDKPETVEPEDDEPGICTSCSGTGLGQTDSTSCFTCNGSGDAK